MNFFDTEIVRHLNAFHTCPECKSGRLLKGPSRGSLDVRCDNSSCGKEFWLMVEVGRKTLVTSGGRLAQDRPELYRGYLEW
jgi:hypothetical protein